MIHITELFHERPGQFVAECESRQSACSVRARTIHRRSHRTVEWRSTPEAASLAHAQFQDIAQRTPLT